MGMSDTTILDPRERRDWLFIISGWGFGGLLPVLINLAVFVVTLWSSDKPALRSALLSIILGSVIYLVLSLIIIAWFAFSRTSDGRKMSAMTVGGIVTLVFLGFIIPLTGGIHFSPLVFSLIYLPTVVTWYINKKSHSSKLFCGLCALLYGLILFGVIPTNKEMIMWWSSFGIDNNLEKCLKAAIATLEIASAWAFGSAPSTSVFIKNQPPPIGTPKEIPNIGTAPP